MANLWGALLRWSGWKVDITVPRRDKCVICVAPHTSNLDFFIGLAAYKSLGRNANFLMKEFWFFWPLKFLLRRLGGIPVPPKSKGGTGQSLTQRIIKAFDSRSYMNLAVTPEGTRSRRSEWRRGFLYIASGAGVPIQLGVIDYHDKRVIIRQEFITTGDVVKDMDYVKTYYSHWKDAARYPDKFTT